MYINNTKKYKAYLLKIIEICTRMSKLLTRKNEIKASNIRIFLVIFRLFTFAQMNMQDENECFFNNMNRFFSSLPRTA